MRGEGQQQAGRQLQEQHGCDDVCCVVLRWCWLRLRAAGRVRHFFGVQLTNQGRGRGRLRKQGQREVRSQPLVWIKMH